MQSILNGGLPFIFIGYFFYFRINNNVNNIFLILIFLSYFVFATNYENYGLDFDLYRYIHKTIGVLTIVSLIHHVIINKLSVFDSKVFYLLSFFFFAIGLSFFGNDLYLPHYLHYSRNFLFIFLVVLFIFFKLEEKKNIDELFQFIVDITLIFSIAIIIEAIFVGNINIRAILFYSNPNYLAVSILIGFCILLFTQARYKIFKVFLVMSAIFLCDSDAVFVSVVVVLSIYTFKNISMVNAKKLIVGIAVLVILGSFTFHQKISDAYNGEVRVVLAKVALNAYRDNIINGIGYGQFRTQFYKYVNNEIIKLNNVEVNRVALSYDKALTDEFIKDHNMSRNMEKMTHNDLVKIIVELGSVGALFLLVYFYRVYFELKKILMYNRDYFYISLSLLAGILIFSMFHNNITSFIFWFVLFLPFVMNKIYPEFVS